MAHIPLYDLAVSAYTTAVRCASPFHPKAKKMIQGRSCALKHLQDNRDANRKYIWIHAASLGEFEQGRPLMEYLKTTFPDIGICLTFFSPSGYEAQKKYPCADIVTYLPFDNSNDLSEFISTLSPIISIFIKYEFWLHTLDLLHQRNIPIFLISAIFRPNHFFFRPWGSIFRKRLKYYTQIFVQDSLSQTLLQQIGITTATVTGDTRMDRVNAIMQAGKNIPLIHDICEKIHSQKNKVIVFGSSWEADEKVYLPITEQYPNLFVIIAPHEITPAHITFIQTKSKRKVHLLSQLSQTTALTPAQDLLVIDSIGLLSALYRYADLAYIGGGFQSGIHNTAEAAVYGIPVIFGPKHKKFREAKDLIACGGGFSVSDSEEFQNILQELLSNEEQLQSSGLAAGCYIQSQLGATKKIAQYISSYIK